MKKLFLAVAALGMLATSCTKDQTAPVVVEESLVSFEVSAPVISSRAVDAYDVYGTGEAVENLHYAVYLTEGTDAAPEYTLVFTDCLEDAFAGDALVNTSLELQLVNDQTYTAIFWADDENAPYTFDAQTMTVTLDPSALAAQDENLDAFFGHHKFLVAGPKVERVTLERPFSQLNIATADIEAAKAAGVVVDADTKTAVKVTGLYTKLNLLTEEIDETSEVEVTFAAAPKAVGQIDTTYEMLSMNYLLVNERKLVDVTFDVETKAGQKVNRLFQNVPVERNYRTNILGNLFVDNIGFEVKILPGFDGVIPTTAEEKLWMAGVVGGEYTLTSDVELSKTLQVTENLILNLNGHNITVNNTSSELGEGDGIIVTNGHLTINGEGTVTANTRAVWARGNGGAKVTINGGKYVGANGFTTEVIYASGNGQITINGGEFEAVTEDPTSFAAPQYAVLNLHGNGKDGCDINVYGGKFKNFDPANNVSENPNAGYHNGNFVAEGLFSSKVGDYYVVSDAIHAETPEVLAAALTSDLKEIKVILVNDINVPITSLGQQTGGSGEYKLGGVNTEKISIDLGGNKLNITTTYWSAIGAKNDNALFTIKNGSMTSTGNSAGTWNAWDLRFSNCNYVFEGVDFEKAVALDNVGKSTSMKDVTITDTHNTDTYGLWITAEGQTVTLEDCVIDMTPASDGRGIKIDEQYVDASTKAKVTLNVKNTTFATEEKAAILVKSTEGAEINVENIDITGVVADDEFAVWVDSDAAAHASKVVVNGAWVKIEGENATYVTPATLASATADVLYLTAGDYGTIVAKAGKTYAAVNADAKVEAVNICGAANVTLRNITFDVATAKAAYDNSTRRSYANIFSGDLTNKPSVGARNLVVDGCTFAGTFVNAGAAIAFADRSRPTGGSGNVTIKNCTFATEGGYYDIYGYYTGHSGMNFVFENNTFKSEIQGNAIYLGRLKTSAAMVVKGNTFEKFATLDDAVYVKGDGSWNPTINASNNTFAN